VTDLKINDVRPRLQILQTDADVRTFDLPFAVLSADHLKVAIDDGPPNQATYSVDRLNETDGARITFETAPPLGARISVWRDMPVERVTDFLNDGTFRASALNRELDRLAMLLQQLEARVEETLRAAPSDLDQALMLPPVEARANRILSFDADGAPETRAALEALDVVAANLQDLRNYADTYLGASAAPPQTRADGGSLQAGDLFFDTAAGVMKVFDAAAAAWVQAYSPIGNYLLRDGSLAMTGALEAPNVTVGGQPVWHAGLQGPGSGLDADTLDGVEAAALALEADRAALESRLAKTEVRLALNTLRDAIDRGWSVSQMVGGFADAFNDPSGVAQWRSHWTPQSAADWVGAVAGSASFGVGSVSLDNDGAVRSLEALEGDFALSVTVSDTTGMRMGVFDAAEIAAFDQTAADGGLSAMTKHLGIETNGAEIVSYAADGAAADVSAQTSGAAFADGDRVTLIRRAGLFALYHCGKRIRSFTASFTEPVHLMLGDGSTPAWTEIAARHHPVGGSSRVVHDAAAATLAPAHRVVPDGAAAWEGRRGVYTFDGAGVSTSDTQNSAIYWRDARLTGDFVVRWTHASGTYPMYALIPEDALTLFRQSDWEGDADLMANSFHFRFGAGSFNALYAGVSEGNPGVSAMIDRVIEIRRVGGYVSLWIDDVQQIQMSAPFHDPMRFLIGGADGWPFEVTGLSAELLQAPDAIFLSARQTASVQPVAARAVLVAQSATPPVLNSDVVLEVSRDDGATWTAGTLSAEAPYDALSTIYVTDEIDLVAQPAGSDMRLRVRTINQTVLTLHAWTLQWR